MSEMGTESGRKNHRLEKGKGAQRDLGDRGLSQEYPCRCEVSIDKTQLNLRDSGALLEGKRPPSLRLTGAVEQ